DTTSLIETGTVAQASSLESFSLTETTISSPTITETGNSVTGDYTISETGTANYTVDQIINPPPPSGGGQGGGGSATTWYSLHETGSNPTSLIQTGSTVTGVYSQTITGSDSYTLSEVGQISQSALLRTYTETQTATDTSTVIEIGNSLNGLFQRTVTGAIAGSMVEAGNGNGVGYIRPTDIS